MEKSTTLQDQEPIIEKDKARLLNVRDAVISGIGEIARPFIVMAHVSLLLQSLIPELQIKNYQWGPVRLNVDIDSAEPEKLSFLENANYVKKLEGQENYSVKGKNQARMILWQEKAGKQKYFSCGEIQTHEQYNRTSKNGRR